MRIERIQTGWRLLLINDSYDNTFDASHDDDFCDPLQSILRRRKCLTLAQANRTLPLVERIVRDVQAAHRGACEIHERLIRRMTSQQRDDVERELDRMVDRLHRYVDELAELGAEVKDYTVGLIDFVGTHKRRHVYLCWKPGDTQIHYWHELAQEFTERQPVEMLEE
jgi:hypothetical protein